MAIRRVRINSHLQNPVDVGLVLSRDVRILEKDDPPAAILEDFERDFGVASPPSRRAGKRMGRG